MKETIKPEIIFQQKPRGVCSVCLEIVIFIFLSESHVTDAGENRLMYVFEKNRHIYLFYDKTLSNSSSFGKDIRKFKDTG